MATPDGVDLEALARRQMYEADRQTGYSADPRFTDDERKLYAKRAAEHHAIASALRLAARVEAAKDDVAGKAQRYAATTLAGDNEDVAYDYEHGWLAAVRAIEGKNP